MAKNFIQSGNVITIPAPKAVKSGDGIDIYSLFGIATLDVDVGEDLPLALVGVFQLPKNNTAMQIGDKLYWDSDKQVVTKAATDNVYAGLSIEAAQIGDAWIKVRLGGSG